MIKAKINEHEDELNSYINDDDNIQPENHDCSLLDDNLINDKNDSFCSNEDDKFDKSYGENQSNQNNLKKSTNLTEYSLNPLENSFLNKQNQNYLHHNSKDSVISFKSQPMKTNNGEKGFTATSPLRYRPERQNENTENVKCDPNSGHNSFSHSRSRSGYRKMSTSPVEINTSYELSYKNTENLWREFRSNIRDKSSPRQTRPLRRKDIQENRNENERQPLSEKNMQRSFNNDEISVETFQGNTYDQIREDRENERQKSRTQALNSNHLHKPSFTSNIDTNQFIDTSKTDLKNQLMDEKHIKKLIQVSDSRKARTTLRDNVSFDHNTQVLPGLRINEMIGSHKQSHASQFTFNSTEKIHSNDYDESKSNYTFKDGDKNQFINHLNLSNKSRIRIISGPNTFEGNREEKLDEQEFPIMNSVRQVIQANNNSNRDYGQHSKRNAIKKSRSRSKGSSNGRKSNKSINHESTQVIRDRLRNKIETLRSKLSSSHHDTILSNQEQLNVPLTKTVKHNKDKKSLNIETMRIHSRDGSKSIEGSGLELDDYVSVEDPKQEKYSYAEKPDHLSSKYETFNTISHHGESVRTHNSMISKSQEARLNQENQQTRDDYKNHTNVTQLEQYFTIEDINKSGDNFVGNATQKRLTNRTKLVEKRHSSKSANRSFNKRSQKLSSEKSKSKSKKKIYDYSGNSSNVMSCSRSKSNSKIKQNRGITKVILSNKNKDVNNDTIHNVKSDVYFSNAYTHRSDESDYSDTENMPPNSIFESHQNSKRNGMPPYSMTKRMKSKPTVSPKRNMTFYKKSQSHQRLVKPNIKPCHNRSADKRQKQAKLPPKYKPRLNTDTSDQKQTKIIKKVLNSNINMNKVNVKIFKCIDECQKLLDEKSPNYNTCLNKLITVDKLVTTEYTDTDVVSIYVKYLVIKCHFELKDYERCTRHIEVLSKRVFQLYHKRRLKRESANLLLHIHKMLGDVHMAKQRWKKAAEIYTELIQLYSLWKSCSYRITNDD